ncbi:MAG: hypothetical protein KatS3mg103_1441 [Phycisphaerales bacterium]|nr:MAG: hypothetical protein KatS3mg103_1441 [Phycisphaerales bacterium]
MNPAAPHTTPTAPPALWQAAGTTPPIGLARTPAHRPGGALVARQQDFAAALARARPPQAGVSPARQAAEDFVAMAFVEPLLAHLREHSQAQPPFAPGPAERQFGALLDHAFSRQIVRRSSWPLIDRIEQDLDRQSQALRRAQTQTKPQTEPQA